MSQFILDYVQAKPFLLLERVAYEVADQLQQRFGISWLRLKLSKPKAEISNQSAVSFLGVF